MKQLPTRDPLLKYVAPHPTRWILEPCKFCYRPRSEHSVRAWEDHESLYAIHRYD